MNSPQWPPPSIQDRARRSNGERQQRHLTNFFDRPTNRPLRRPLESALFTLFTVMTLEGWTNDVARPVMEKHPHGWLFFVIFIIVTTFMVLNLFIGVVVNAMQAEAMKAEADEREAEREMIQEEAAPILAEVKNLRKEIAELRAQLAGQTTKSGA